MTDKEKVVKGLECCLGSNDCDIEPEEDCPYKEMCLCAMALRFDVFALLKEQEEAYHKGYIDGYQAKTIEVEEDADLRLKGNIYI